MTPAVRDTNPFYAVYFTADLPQAYNRTLVGIARGCIDTGNSCHCSGRILILNVSWTRSRHYVSYCIICKICIIIFSKTQYNTLAMLMSESWTSQKPRRIILARYNKSWRTLFEMEIQMTMWVYLSSNITHNLWVINYNRFKTGSLTDVPFNKMVSFRDSRMVSLDHFQSSSKTGLIQA